MTCNCPAHRKKRGEPPAERQVREPVKPQPFPGSSVEDRYHDWKDALEDGTCTGQCGRARDDVCRCRCRGLFHSASHDYWASKPVLPCFELPGGSTIHRSHDKRPCTLQDRIPA